VVEVDLFFLVPGVEPLMRAWFVAVGNLQSFASAATLIGRTCVICKLRLLVAGGFRGEFFQFSFDFAVFN